MELEKKLEKILRVNTPPPFPQPGMPLPQLGSLVRIGNFEKSSTTTETPWPPTGLRHIIKIEGTILPCIGQHGVNLHHLSFLLFPHVLSRPVYRSAHINLRIKQINQKNQEALTYGASTILQTKLIRKTLKN